MSAKRGTYIIVVTLLAAARPVSGRNDDRQVARKYLELSKSLVLNYGLADPAQKARLLRIAMSNCKLYQKKLCFEPRKWLCEVESTLNTLCGAPVRDRTRTTELISEIDALVRRTRSDFKESTEGGFETASNRALNGQFD